MRPARTEMSSPVSAFVEAWAAGIRARDAAAVADLFDEGVLFCATAPDVLHGREKVRTYYENLPQGLTPEAVILNEVSPIPGVVHGVVGVVFTAPGVGFSGRIGVTLIHREAGWRVSQYHLAVGTPKPLG